MAHKTDESDPLQFLTVAHVAEKLGVSDETVRAYCRDGSLPAMRLRRQYRIRRADLWRFMDARGVQPKGGYRQLRLAAVPDESDGLAGHPPPPDVIPFAV